MRWICALQISSLAIAIFFLSGSSHPAHADTPEARENPFAFSCPILLKPLLNQILPDLPSYINRNIQRQRQAGEPLHYLLGFSEPDYRPASLADFSDRHPEFALAPLLETPNLYQFFLTSRERTYDDKTTDDFQEFHWLLFQQNDRFQWELRAIFSQDQQGQIRNSRTEPIAQGIEQRLQECWRTN